MRKTARYGLLTVSLVLLGTGAKPGTSWSAEDIPHPSTYILSLAQLEKHKKPFDDPRPYLTTIGPKQVLPPKLYAKLSYDVNAMKEEWSELVGFKAPDLVGKIAPEIKPGKYSYKDLAKYPGLKELMWPEMYNRIKPGAPPHAGNIPEFEIIPTRQYYYALPIAEATKKNLGKSKLDAKGYLIPESWQGGYPFPKPSGPFKAQQVMYNVEKRSLAWELSFYLLGRIMGFTKDLKMDFDGSYDVAHLRLAGRTLMPPYGWFDERAKQRKEFKSYAFGFLAPRDVYGTVQGSTYFLDPTEADQLMIYIPSLRRIRKMSATDTQDPVMGQDQIYDDTEGWNQKLSPTRFPYKFEIVAEREYLCPASSIDGSEYISSKGFELHNVKMERRPMYVVKLTQLDPNYVYSYRLFYVDMETFNYIHVENYDRKGRLYRTFELAGGFHPEMGIFSWSGGIGVLKDHIDLHSGLSQSYQLPAFYTREDVSLQAITKKAQ
ncbi:MAG: DUF1329 domain-containing protein [Deltaproteobacteria bacterium]|nr:DUF1329 domain-containing protein [Deltaproteobacteria bacterium]